jgi:hypothetical protein
LSADGFSEVQKQMEKMAKKGVVSLREYKEVLTSTTNITLKNNKGQISFSEALEKGGLSTDKQEKYIKKLCAKYVEMASAVKNGKAA